MPYPFIQSFQHRGRLTEAEVALPASYVGRQFLRHLLPTDPSCPSRQFPNLLLATQQGLRRDAPLRLLVTAEAEPQAGRFCLGLFGSDSSFGFVLQLRS